MELIEIIVMRAQLAAMSADELHALEDIGLEGQALRLLDDEVRRRTEGPAARCDYCGLGHTTRDAALDCCNPGHFV